ncbi:phosphoribulokinase [Trebonia sp.]|uniref:phosphoribulokinase n=1 Tax=Trebonia sp. TaxID=2767075 RepID=UPI00263307A3|nr:phosphoribulokinase [Trebonia sp.]
MPRPIMLSIAGDSGSGKTTITRGVVRVLGDDRVTHFCADDYHRYDRRQRAERCITPLDPACNYLDVLTCDIRHLRHNEAILKPVYQHTDGTFGPPVYMSPARFVVAEGLLINHTSELRDMFDIRVYLNPPEDVRRRWKVARDCSRRGYSTDQVLRELDRRERDSEAYIRPQRHYADIVISFMPGTPGQSQDPGQLDAHLFLRDSLPHPDLAGVVGDGADADDLTLTEQPGEKELRIPGTISPARAVALEEAIWDRMQFASHLRAQRLGEFTIGSDLHRSEALGLTQLLLLYHLVTARAVIALGGQSARASAQSSADIPVPDQVPATNS